MTADVRHRYLSHEGGLDLRYGVEPGLWWTLSGETGNQGIYEVVVGIRGDDPANPIRKRLFIEPGTDATGTPRDAVVTGVVLERWRLSPTCPGIYPHRAADRWGREA